MNPFATNPQPLAADIFRNVGALPIILLGTELVRPPIPVAPDYGEAGFRRYRPLNPMNSR